MNITLETLRSFPTFKRLLKKVSSMKEIELITMSFMREKIKDQGEDSEPLVRLFPGNSGLIGVFDGLGGAGSAIFSEGDVPRSGAYYASRYAKEIVEKHFKSIHDPSNKQTVYEAILGLNKTLASEFKQKAGQLDKNPSKLKSSLIKRLPTTMASIYFEKTAEIVTAGHSDAYQCFALWAGDSRCYCLEMKEGLHQLSVDDIISEGDALENLISDSPLSNYVNSDNEFCINIEGPRLLPIPCILMVATDGCFGYLPTPMHFEYLLLETLQDSEDPKAWENALVSKLYGHYKAADDISMALVAIGWRDFEDLKTDFKKRQVALHNDYIDVIDKVTAEIRSHVQEQKRLEQKMEEERKQRWEQYKKWYQPSGSKVRVETPLRNDSGETKS